MGRMMNLGLLLWAFFSIYIISIAPDEFKKINEVKSFDKVKVYLEHIETRAIKGSKQKIIGAVIVYDSSNNRMVRISDLRPGDFENDAIRQTFINNKEFFKKYREKSQIYVYRSKNHRRYFLEQGNPLLFIILSVIAFGFWALVLIRILMAFAIGRNNATK